MAEKIMKPGVWLRRGDRLAVAVQVDPEAAFCRWRGSDGKCRFDDGRYYLDRDSEWDLVECLEVPERPQPQPDAAEELAAVRHEAEPHPGGIMAEGVAVRLSAGNFSAEYRESIESLTDDRDRWQTRARQAEGRVATLTQELTAVTANRDGLGRRIHETENDRDKWRGRVTEATGRVAELEGQVNDLQAQLEAAAAPQPTPHDFERVAAERDAAREEARGLQVRAQQAEGDARQANAKIRHHEHAAARWQTHAESKNILLLKAEGAVNALQVVIMNLVREVSNDD
mgnify:CR=1 FL=1